MLLVQEYLKTKTFGELAKEHGVYASFSKSGHKFSLNYDQLEAKESDPLAQQCRGLILSLKDGSSLLPQALTIPGQKTSYDLLCPGDTLVLAYPMNRFFNHGQGAAAEINWQDPGLAVMEKLDGTLCIVYFDVHTNAWCVATRAVSEADLPLDNNLFTFRTLFEKAVKDSLKMDFSEFTKGLNPWITYCFELTTPYNRIVVDYQDCAITLLAMRNVSTYQEVDIHHPDIADRIPHIPRVQMYKLKTIDEIVNWVSEQNPVQHEGVVVLDSKFNRIKIKNAAYLAFNRARDVLGSSSRNCLELILAEKDDDVLQVLPPEIVKNLLTIKEDVKNLINHYDDLYEGMMRRMTRGGAPVTKKDFALNLQMKGIKWQAPFFQMFDKKAANMKEFIAKNRKDGTWGNGFLDKILETIEEEKPKPGVTYY